MKETKLKLQCQPDVESQTHSLQTYWIYCYFLGECFFTHWFLTFSHQTRGLQTIPLSKYWEIYKQNNWNAVNKNCHRQTKFRKQQLTKKRLIEPMKWKSPFSDILCVSEYGSLFIHPLLYLPSEFNTDAAVQTKNSCRNLEPNKRSRHWERIKQLFLWCFGHFSIYTCISSKLKGHSDFGCNRLLL